MKPGSQRHLYDLPAMSAAHPPTPPEPRHPLWPEEEDAAMSSVSLLSKLANPKFPQKAISRATRRRTRLSPRRLPRKCLVAALPLWKRRPGQRCCFGLAPGLRPKTGPGSRREELFQSPLCGRGALHSQFQGELCRKNCVWNRVDPKILKQLPAPCERKRLSNSIACSKSWRPTHNAQSESA